MATGSTFNRFAAGQDMGPCATELLSRSDLLLHRGLLLLLLLAKVETTLGEVRVLAMRLEQAGQK